MAEPALKAVVKESEALSRYNEACDRIRALLEERAGLVKAPLSKSDVLQDVGKQVEWARDTLHAQVGKHLKRFLTHRAQRIEPPAGDYPVCWVSPPDGTSGILTSVNNALAVLALAPLVRETVEQSDGFGELTREQRRQRIEAIDAEIKALRAEVRPSAAKIKAGHWSCVPSRFTYNETTGQLEDSWPAIP